MTLRAPSEEDVPAIAELLRAAAAVDGIGGGDEAEIRNLFTAPGFDRDGNVRLAFRGERLVGYGDVADWTRRGEKFVLDVRGETEELLPWGEERARGLGGSRIRMQAWSENAQLLRTLDARGWRPIRHSFVMEIELDGPPPDAEWPDGVEVRAVDPERDEPALYDAHTETFADAWEEPLPYDEWRHWHYERDDFDPALYHVVEADGEIAAYAVTRLDYAGRPGWINILGVRPQWRRRGIGLALLRHAFGEFHRRGATRVGLGVDTQNETGATKLYERAGMAVARRFTTFEKEL